MKSGMSTMAPDPILVMYFLSPSHQSEYLYAHPPCCCYTVAWYTFSCSNEYMKQRQILVYIVFCALHIISKGSLWVCLYVPLLFQGNGSVNTFHSDEELLEA
jgi:hypothetical protein